MFANFYHRFIRNYGIVAEPLTALTFSKVKFNWMPTAEEAFRELKSRFTSAPILCRQTRLVSLSSKWMLRMAV